MNTSPPANPWLGLRSYTEADQGEFHGRDAEAGQLLGLVHREQIVVMHGLSGLGKTSLLNAGLFPRLARENYLPVAIRIGSFLAEGATGNLTLAVTDSIAKAACRPEGNWNVPRSEPCDSLWKYFHRCEQGFWTPRNCLATPVMVFDQFEEIFTIGRRNQANRRAVLGFLKELSALIDNRPYPSGANLEDEFSFDAVPLRILFSVREDFVGHLAELRSYFPSIRKAELRLLPMLREEARKVIFIPGERLKLIEPDFPDEVIKLVAAQQDTDTTTQADEQRIEPALLSAVLSEMYESVMVPKWSNDNAQKLTAADVTVRGESILDGYCERAFQALSDDDYGTVVWWVENELITPDGFRAMRTVSEANAADVQDDSLRILENERLIRVEDRPTIGRCVEIIHDRLCEPIKRVCEKRREAENKAAEEGRQASRLATETMKQARLRLIWKVGGIVGMAVIITVILLFQKSRLAVRRSQLDAERAELRRLIDSYAYTSIRFERVRDEGQITTALRGLEDRKHNLVRLLTLLEVSEKNIYETELAKTLIARAVLLVQKKDYKAAISELAGAQKIYEILASTNSLVSASLNDVLPSSKIEGESTQPAMATFDPLPTEFSKFRLESSITDYEWPRVMGVNAHFARYELRLPTDGEWSMLIGDEYSRSKAQGPLNDVYRFAREILQESGQSNEEEKLYREQVRKLTQLSSLGNARYWEGQLAELKEARGWELKAQGQAPAALIELYSARYFFEDSAFQVCWGSGTDDRLRKIERKIITTLKQIGDMEKLRGEIVHQAQIRTAESGFSLTSPTWWDYLEESGDVLQELGDLEKAAQQFATALELIDESENARRKIQEKTQKKVEVNSDGTISSVYEGLHSNDASKQERRITLKLALVYEQRKELENAIITMMKYDNMIKASCSDPLRGVLDRLPIRHRIARIFLSKSSFREAVGELRSLDQLLGAPLLAENATPEMKWRHAAILRSLAEAVSKETPDDPIAKSEAQRCIARALSLYADLKKTPDFVSVVEKELSATYDLLDKMR